MTKRNSFYIHLSIWVASIVVSIVAVSYAKFVSWIQGYYFYLFEHHKIIIILLTPLGFLCARAIVYLFAKEAKGSGIPEVLKAIEISKQSSSVVDIWDHRFISIRTAFFKILSSTIGFLCGASIGREGPTVQVAASGFAWIGSKLKKMNGPNIDFTSFLTTGAAAGVAAAFNTPLAGVAFAIEEMSEGSFGPYKQLVVLGVIIAGITSQALAGDYLYFGHPVITQVNFFTFFILSIPLGVLGGLLGGLFSWFITYADVAFLTKKWWLKALICGVICSIIGMITNGQTSGSGYEITRQFLDSNNNETPQIMFPIWKFLSTIASYHSGMAGGIFSPCLSIGGGLGFSFAALIHSVHIKTCGLIGMVAFFSGVVQAPLTAVIIVMEMTDEHALIVPFMASAYLSQIIAKVIMPTSLYRSLAKKNT